MKSITRFIQSAIVFAVLFLSAGTAPCAKATVLRVRPISIHASETVNANVDVLYNIFNEVYGYPPLPDWMPTSPCVSVFINPNVTGYNRAAVTMVYDTWDGHAASAFTDVPYTLDNDINASFSVDAKAIRAVTTTFYNSAVPDAKLVVVLLFTATDDNPTGSLQTTLVTSRTR